jgi:hypothetical protein
MTLAYGTLTEGVHAGGFMVSEAQGTRSRAKITVLSGQDLDAGTVLGAVSTGTGSSAVFAGNTGNGAMGAITVSGAAKAGAYRLVIVEPASNAGNFIVTAPDGSFVGQGDVAAAFSAGGLAFTLADGATDFASGDGFTITVAVSATKYKLYDPANTDGSGVAAGILWDNTDATGGDKEAAAVVRAAEVNAAELVWFGSADAAAKVVGLADLAKLGIIGR